MAKENIFDLTAKWDNYFKPSAADINYALSMKGNENQIFKDARQEEDLTKQKHARSFLINVAKNRLLSIFWKAYMGKDKVATTSVIARRIQNGEFEDFCGLIFENLDNGVHEGRTGNALYSFKEDKYATNVIASWQYWFGQYVEASSIAENKKKKDAKDSALAGQAISIDATEEEKDDKSGHSKFDKMAYDSGLFDQINEDAATFNEDFTEALKDVDDSKYDVKKVIKLFILNYDKSTEFFQKVQDELGISRGTTTTILTNFFGSLADYGVSQDELKKRLHSDREAVAALIK